MEFRRKAYQKLLDWKRHGGRSALMIDGARRVGKSYLCKYFGENEYRSMILIDFANIPRELMDMFENDRNDFDLFFTKLSTYYRTKLYPRESLIIFDEVQQYPIARQFIKYLVEDGRYDYIETGSLISLKQNVKEIVIPSEEELMQLFPFDFEEFLWAMGDETTMPFIKTCFENRKPLGQALHRKTMNAFRQYLLVGGMPQAVAEYCDSRDFAETDRVKREILTLYRNDISKFAYGYESKVRAIFDTIPGQLAKKEKKYKLASISKTARLREYEDAFMWLADAMIVNPCFNATEPHVGLSMSIEHTTQKIYMADTGLLVSHAFMDKEYSSNDLYRDILFDKITVNEGMIAENMAAQMLRTAGHRLYFYSRMDANNRQNMMEIDFLIVGERKICPVEVKSSAYQAHSSLDKFRRKYHADLDEAYILYPKDVMVKDGVVHLPLYMGALL